VRVILNGAGGAERNAKNVATAHTLNEQAAREGLDLAVRLGSLPDSRANRDGAIHNKMLLVRAGDEAWSHVGSANGSETAHRYNREVGLSIESAELFEYLAEVFRADWELAAAPDPAKRRPGAGVLDDLPASGEGAPRRR